MLYLNMLDEPLSIENINEVRSQNYGQLKTEFDERRVPGIDHFKDLSSAEIDQELTKIPLLNHKSDLYDN